MSSTGMPLKDRIKRSITQRGDEVFVRNEFAKFGSPAQISRVLRELVATGRLGCWRWHLRQGKTMALTGKAIPVRPVDVLRQLH